MTNFKANLVLHPFLQRPGCLNLLNLQAFVTAFVIDRLYIETIEQA